MSRQHRPLDFLYDNDYTVSSAKQLQRDEQMAMLQPQIKKALLQTRNNHSLTARSSSRLPSSNSLQGKSESARPVQSAVARAATCSPDVRGINRFKYFQVPVSVTKPPQIPPVPLKRLSSLSQPQSIDKPDSVNSRLAEKLPGVYSDSSSGYLSLKSSYTSQLSTMQTDLPNLPPPRRPTRKKKTVAAEKEPCSRCWRHAVPLISAPPPRPKSMETLPVLTPTSPSPKMALSQVQRPPSISRDGKANTSARRLNEKALRSSLRLHVSLSPPRGRNKREEDCVKNNYRLHLLPDDNFRAQIDKLASATDVALTPVNSSLTMFLQQEKARLGSHNAEARMAETAMQTEEAETPVSDGRASAKADAATHIDERWSCGDAVASQTDSALTAEVNTQYDPLQSFSVMQTLTEELQIEPFAYVDAQTTTTDFSPAHQTTLLSDEISRSVSRITSAEPEGAPQTTALDKFVDAAIKRAIDLQSTAAASNVIAGKLVDQENALCDVSRFVLSSLFPDTLNLALKNMETVLAAKEAGVEESSEQQ